MNAKKAKQLRKLTNVRNSDTFYLEGSGIQPKYVEIPGMGSVKASKGTPLVLHEDCDRYHYKQAKLNQ